MSRSIAFLLAVLVVGSVLGGVATAGPAGLSEADPSVSVTVNSEPVADGDHVETGFELDITVSAAVSESVPDGTELSEIVVRANGESRATVDVEGTSVTETFSPDLDNGNNTVRVIVTDEAGNVNSTRFTVDRDVSAPHVYLTSPYETRPYYRISDGRTNGSDVTFSGWLVDGSDIEKLRVIHDYGGGEGETYVRRDGSANFSIPMELGYTTPNATNSFILTAVDEYDNVRRYTFQIDVGDGAAPTVSPEPYPNETTDGWVYFSGTVSDDVWVREASVSLRPVDGWPENESATARGINTETIAEPRSYDYQGGRRSVSFNESFFMNGYETYEFVVTVTDLTNKTTTRTYQITRRETVRDRSPEVVVDRDRTVVLEPETLFVSGASLEGTTQRLVVETRDAATGDTVDYQRLHDGGYTDRVDFSREVGIGSGLTEVIVRATGSDGVEVTERFYVNGTSLDVFVENDTRDPWPAVAVTSLTDDRPKTASSAVTVRRARGGETVRVPGHTGDVVAGTANVTLERLDVALATDGNATATVAVSERGADALRGPPGVRAAGTVRIQHSVSADRVDGVTLLTSVDRSYLASAGIEAEDLTLYRRSGGQWNPLDTRVVNETSETVRYRMDSPGLSVFALAPSGAGGPVTADQRTSDGTLVGQPADLPEVTATGGPGGNWTVDSLPDGPTDNSSSAGQSSNGSTAESADAARIFVSNVTLNRTKAAVNESVTVTAMLENVGEANGSYVAGLTTIRGVNRTSVATRAVPVPAGGQETVEFETAFAEPGNHTVSVNGTRAGPVVVSSGGGGLLSVFSFIPVRLVGLALGGLLGFGVVLTLVRFVIRRVGGSGETGG
jgi:PGF-pre-PGF domain-containing protein